MFRGSKEEDGTWSWKMIIGDKNQGALYDIGIGVKESGAGNLFVYDNYLYIGNYNDPMLDLAEIPNNGSFELVYNDLVNAVNLYRMDEKEGYKIIELDLDYVDKIRKELPLLSARRVDLYK